MTRRPVQRGEVYLYKAQPAPFNSAADDEAGGAANQVNKARPLVVVSRDDLNGGHSVLAVPFYSQQLDKRRQQRSCVYFSGGEAGLSKNCVAKCDEVTLFDKLDIDLAKGPIGRVNALKMKEIVKAIRWCVRDDDLT